MRKTFLALALIIPLTGCAGLADGFKFATASVENPVTPAMMYDVENGLRVATAGLLTYRRLCILKKVDVHCRANIEKIQVYSRAAKPVLVNLRAYVRDNDQVNAISAFNTLRQIIADINTAKAAAGVQ
jgi:hypothetical protein